MKLAKKALVGGIAAAAALAWLPATASAAPKSPAAKSPAAKSPAVSVKPASKAKPAPKPAPAPSPSRGEASQAPLTFQDLAVSGVGYPIYRIAALTTTVKGTLIAAYDGRPGMSDLPSNITDLVRRSTNNGKTWTTQQVVRGAAAPDGFGDPSLVVDHRTGRIFDFYAAGVNTGFASSTTGNSETDPNVLQADYSYSDDDGVTWTSRRITSMIKNPAWGGLFAASGQGIQLTSGPYAGRLVQQYVVEYNGGEYAASAYSDDDGATWQMGQLVGPNMNENKVVQLANGNLMLNVRSAPYRMEAISTDGGATWSKPTADTQLPDPSDNGSIIRVAPNAPASDPTSHMLLLSNNDSTTDRANLIVRMSCDDGKTWPISRVVDSGDAAYSTLTRLPNGRFGLLFERGDYQAISYTSFDLNWLGGTCASLAVNNGPTWVEAGTSSSLNVTVTNENAAGLPSGTIQLAPVDGVTSKPVVVKALKPGQQTTVSVPYSVAAGTPTGTTSLSVDYQSHHKSAGTPSYVTVLGQNAAWEDTTQHVTNGTTAVDDSASLSKVSSLSSGTVAVAFHTTQSAPAAVLLSAANPGSTTADLIVSLNNGYPYVEVRTGAGTYPVRISTGLAVNDGKEHVLAVTSTGGSTEVLLDGQVIADASGQGFFSSVAGLGNLTLGADVAATGTRWGFVGTIDRVGVFSG